MKIYGYELDDAMSKYDPDYEEPGVRMHWWERRMRNLASRFKRLRATNSGTRFVERSDAKGNDDYGEESTEVHRTKREW